MGNKIPRYQPFDSPPTDSVGIQSFLNRIRSRSIAKHSKIQALKLVTGLIDLTTLEGKDTDGRIKQLCYKAMHPSHESDGMPGVAAVCVYPTFIKTAKKALLNSKIKVVAVTTSFPSGHAPLSLKIEETKYALDEGADEIDMVISRGKFFQGEYEFVFDEIAAIKQVCGRVHLKVILETGELAEPDYIRKASDIAIRAGADFLKTSTGKIQPAATPEATLVMLHAIRDNFLNTGKMIGIKVAGGISSASQALYYLVMVKETLGDNWLNAQYFRIGASSLLYDINRLIRKDAYGVFPGRDYLALD